MRWSQSFITTYKEIPSQAEIISHQLMLRAGIIHPLSAGAYTYLPLGFRVLNKIVAIVREEMESAGAAELLMPAMHPIEIWEETGRAEDFGPVLLKIIDRHGRKQVLGPTHEEIITDLVRNKLRSYKQFPVVLFQIQTKFRDEARPRFGVMRTKEFLMKDAYSFHSDWDSLDASYEKMFRAYCNIFSRCGLRYEAIEADSGAMGGDVSHEFMLQTEAGEDNFVKCPDCGYTANVEKAEQIDYADPTNDLKTTYMQIAEVDTPGVTTIEQVSDFLEVESSELAKTILYCIEAEDKKSFVAVLVRGDYEINEAKLSKMIGVTGLRMATPEEIQDQTGGPVGFTGPVGLKTVRIVADFSLRQMTNFVTGANKPDKHFINVNLSRDFDVDEWGDLRFVNEGDPCPKCSSNLTIQRGVEIGHLFKLGTKYSSAMKALFIDQSGKEQPIIMGCYGIGINRIMASLIEMSHDENGIIWPLSIAPYQVELLPVKVDDEKISAVTESLYKKLADERVEVLLDDRDLSAGVKFKDADLVGIPIRITVGNRTLKEDSVELKLRGEGEPRLVKIDEIISVVKEVIDNSLSRK